MSGGVQWLADWACNKGVQPGGGCQWGGIAQGAGPGNVVGLVFVDGARFCVLAETGGGSLPAMIY